MASQGASLVPSRNPSPGKMRSTASSPTRQRGVFSEVLRPNGIEEVQQAIQGPTSARNLQSLKAHATPRSTSFSPNKRDFSNTLGKEAQADVAPVDPKVIEPFDQAPGKAPRKVVVERKKKWFQSQDIQHLLSVRGINYSDPSFDENRWLPLEPFDDLEFDARTPEEWINMGWTDGSHPGEPKKTQTAASSMKEKEFMPLAAQGLRPDNAGAASWVPCLVCGFDAKTAKFEVQWVSDKQTWYLTRLQLLFDAEDPTIFADRVAKAHTCRRFAEGLIRYQFYVDNMPTDELATLDADQISRIFDSAQNKIRKISFAAGAAAAAGVQGKDFAQTPEVQTLLKEIQLDFARTMNKIIFDKYIENHKDDLMFKDFVLPPKPGDPPVPWEECNVVGETIIYATDFQKPLRLDEYRQIEKTAISQAQYALKDTWSQQVQRLIVRHFENVGRGWFNMQETNKETYEFGKLKKYLNVVRFMMQDTIRSVTIASVAKFVEVIEKFIPSATEVKGVQDVCNTYDTPFIPQENGPSERFCLFTVEMGKAQAAATEGGGEGGQLEFKFLTDPKVLIDETLELFKKGVQALGDITQPERQILKHLFRTQPKLVLAAVSLDEPFVVEATARLEEGLAKSIPPLQAYLELFAQYSSVLALDPPAKVKALEMEEPPVEVEEIKKKIEEHLAEEQKLLDTIPETCDVGIFQVVCRDIRKFLAGKLTQVASLLQDVLAARMKENSANVLDHFAKIHVKLKQQPENIEALSDLKDYLGKVPIEVANLQKELEDNLRISTILEGFKYKITAEDNTTLWQMFGSPKQAVELMQKVDAQLEKQKETFLQAMTAQQTEFEETLNDLETTVAEFHKNYTKIEEIEEIYQNVESVNERLANCVNSSREFNSREGLFGKATTDYTRLQKILKDFEPLSILWKTTYAWLNNEKEWKDGPFQDINAPEMEEMVTSGVKNMFKVARQFREKEMTEVLKIAEKLKGDLEAFKPYVPLVLGLRNDGMRERHWTQVSEAVSGTVQVEIKPEMDNFTLRHLLDLGLDKYAEDIQEIGEKAGKEYGIEKQLRGMKREWERIQFDCKEKYRSTDTYILKGTDIVQAALDEHVVTTQAMQFSTFKKPFEEEIEEWSTQLLLVSETMDEWLKCQRAWLYLQPIFDSPDIMKQLPAEGKRFKAIDQMWRSTMKKTHDNPNVLSICTQGDGLLERFQDANKSLDIVQKGLSDYLETKRAAFARFYFLSDEELLEILSQTKDPTRVQPFLKKVFEAMAKLEFEPDLSATAMYSGEGEKVPFVTPVQTKEKNVEIWMTDTENAMKMGIREVLDKSIQDYPTKPRRKWVLCHPGQCVLNGSQVHWTSEVEEAIDGHEVKKYFDFLKDQLMDMVALVREGLAKMESITVGALIVIDVHAKDVVEKLVLEDVRTTDSFEWISQLRYYWRDDDCWCQCVQTNFPYGYEYLGNTMRLVITPLTDMCYITLMGAQQLNLGGAPAGPAGTGKTETTKDLAKALARQCVVFNCSDMMDYIMVGKFFKGLASSGAWVCFDEFNRINIEVLSVIAQQLLILFGAKHKLKGFNDSTEVEFEGSLIRMYPTFNVFITMNPGYAGRTELPDNLKALFRPMAMMVPDYALIGEIMLYSFGFEAARDLAKKKVATFKLCSEQLSAQDHYDYGMRAVRSVINAAGLLKRQFPSQSVNMDEQQLLLRALRDVNVPKFLKDDLPLFENIISDLFPDTEKPQIDYGDLEVTIRERCTHSHLQPVDPFVMKVIQLFDTCQVRHGLMLVGPTGGGKTCNYRVLQESMTKLKGANGCETVHTHILNPKSIKMGQLYGMFDEITHEWTDGVLAALMRLCTRDTSVDKHWVMFDGPVDAVWIENMNTVLDDNKKLCLNSGEIIALTAHMTMMFEVEDLTVASPATVSRCGMVYMEPEAFGLEPLIDSWLERLAPAINDKVKAKLKELGMYFIGDAITFVRRNSKEVRREGQNMQPCDPHGAA
uniref:Dynein heavy chain 1, axonemal n=1 Tax=Chromera velia CCMP2878 TaxID=1169474 RepID=A0A0G4F0A6_9ALVE|eukprot:Cvel_14326.t1-p1 / transcript=Cvel_14326.t1 / gene=Cvel_14326 / organism=Chromera_velia_CCMP2878 / gene_product=Dynein heavy chain 1, axonemal, putative / transcript_product=Dynein heavy chain 1, axonemal, putative / location=Cvel_scaffold1014:18235-32045(-) / protein_length=1976 / sequence_SO=supercontig / SO=protein_coding / is_pseudo=false